MAKKDSSALRHIQYLSQNRPGALMGMGHYERLLFAHLTSLARDQYSFGITFSGRAPEEKLDAAQLAPNLESVSFLGLSTERLFNRSWSLTQFVMRRQIKQTAPTLYHSLSAAFPVPRHPQSAGIYCIHDLPPARFNDEGRIPAWIKQAVHEAQLIHTPSQFAKDELVELLGLPAEKIQVVFNGCEHDFFHPGVAPMEPEALRALGVQGPFLVYVGGVTQRKNVASLLQAWKTISREYPDLSLVLAGPREGLQAHLQAVGGERVIVAGYLDRVELAGVMKASQGLVFPSIYEGFGLPPLEAMALGVPVIAVYAGAIPEVVGDCGVLAQSGEPEALVTAIRQSLDDSNARNDRMRRGRVRAQLFSWPEHARQILDIYNQVQAN